MLRLSRRTLNFPTYYSHSILKRAIKSIPCRGSPDSQLSKTNNTQTNNLSKHLIRIPFLHPTSLTMALLFFYFYLLLEALLLNANRHHPITARSDSIPIPSACTTANNIVTSCISATPDFNSLSTNEMASCICYTSSTSWVPDTFDQNILSCADYYVTADPAQYSSLVVLEDFCHKAGNVMTAPTSATATITPTGAQTAITAIQTAAIQNAGRAVRISGRGGWMGFAIFGVLYCLV
jgi:hypothetical protein